MRHRLVVRESDRLAGLHGQVLGVELHVLHPDLGTAAATIAGGLLAVAGAVGAGVAAVAAAASDRDEAEGEAGEDQRKKLCHPGNSRCSRSAFWACRRFSAWSQTAERSPYSSSSVISSSGCAGRQCKTTASSRACASRSASIRYGASSSRRRSASS